MYIKCQSVCKEFSWYEFFISPIYKIGISRNEQAQS